MVTHNGSLSIKECLNSIKGLKGPPPEVIVVDNASKDDTVEQVKVTFPTAHTMCLPTNSGYGAGCNTGARVAKGEILVFLNQDVSLTSTFLDSIVPRMLNDPGIGLCGGRVLSWDGTWLASAGQLFDRWTGYGLDYGFGSSDMNLRRPGDQVFSPNGAAFAVRQDVFSQLGGFYENFFLYFEETDLAWRARIAGFKVVCSFDAIIRHMIDARRAHNTLSRYYIDRNSLLSEVRNYELSSLAFFLPITILVRIGGVIVLTLFRRTEHATSTARALNDFFMFLPKVWRERKLVRAIRRLSDREVMRKELLASPRDVLEAFRGSLLPSTARRGATV